MPLTRDFRVTIRERLERDPGFREALLEEGVQCLLAGEVDLGKSVLRDYVWRHRSETEPPSARKVIHSRP